MILFIDNYDSFVYNLARYFQRLGHETQVVRNDQISIAEIRSLEPAAVVISPGPGTPQTAGISLDVVRQLSHELPLLGVCLGHQSLAAAGGGQIVRAREPMHGRTSEVWHDGRGIFAGLPNPFVACRYHSLIVDEASLPATFEVQARTADGTIMAIQHRERPLVGVQFHPEAILTNVGYELLAGFLRVAGLSCRDPRPSLMSELVEPISTAPPLPTLPVTF